MSDEEARFLLEGLKRYPEACSTLSYFQEQLGRKLLAVLEERGSWGRLVLRGEQPFATSLKKNLAATDPYIEATAKGTIDEQATTIELGFWWNCAAVKHPLVLFAGFYDGPDDLVHLRRLAPIPAGYVKFEPQAAYLGKPAGAEFAVELEATNLLDTLLTLSGVIPPA